MSRLADRQIGVGPDKGTETTASHCHDLISDSKFIHRTRALSHCDNRASAFAAEPSRFAEVVGRIDAYRLHHIHEVETCRVYLNFNFAGAWRLAPGLAQGQSVQKPWL